MPISVKRPAAYLMLEGRTDRTAAATHALKQSAVHQHLRFQTWRVCMARACALQQG